MMRVAATARAEQVVAEVRAAHPGAELTFVFGSGCCEGTAPHLFADYVRTPDQQQVGTAGAMASTPTRTCGASTLGARS